MQDQEVRFPMKWHKFLIYFSLWLGAIMNLIFGIVMLAGGQYGGYAAYVYEAFPVLRVVDILMGLVMIALAALCVVARFALAKYRRKGPGLLQLVYAVSALSYLIYLIVAVTSIGGSNIGAQPWIYLGVSVFMMIVNRIYYQKRAMLFVH